MSSRFLSQTDRYTLYGQAYKQTDRQADGKRDGRKETDELAGRPR